MHVSPVKTFFDSILFASIMFNAVAFAEGLPGDDFRDAAEEYEHDAADAIEHAAAADGGTIGRYMQLAAIFREMAAIKRRAGSLADVDRWDKISWDDYAGLEHRRDEILDTLDAHGRDLARQSEPHEDGDYAAGEYRQFARDAQTNAAAVRGAEQAIYRELAEVFNEMAAIKDDAADVERDGDEIDWPRYEDLSQRQQKLKNMLEAGR